jgi:hypothetical protein
VRANTWRVGGSASRRRGELFWRIISKARPRWSPSRDSFILALPFIQFQVSLSSNCEKLFRGTHSQCPLRYRDSVFGLNFHAELFWLLKEQRSGQT